MDTKEFLMDVAFLLETWHGTLIKDSYPVYPAMVGFYMNTDKGEEYFLLGNNTETGDWVIDSETRNERIAEFTKTENASSREIAERVGEWLETLETRVIL